MEEASLIHLDSFHKETIVTAQMMLKKQVKSVYELKILKRILQEAPEDNCIILNIHNGHASMLVCDAEQFEYLFWKLVFGEHLDSQRLQSLANIKLEFAMGSALSQFHLIRDPLSSKFQLTSNLFYVEWMVRGSNYYFGISNLPMVYFHLMAILLNKGGYKLFEMDCCT